MCISRKQQILELMIEHEIGYPEAEMMLLDIEWLDWSEPPKLEELIEISVSRLQDSPPRSQEITF